MKDNPTLIPRTLLTCKRCCYRWFTNRKSVRLPKICPQCKTPYWDIEKVRANKPPAKYRGDSVATINEHTPNIPDGHPVLSPVVITEGMEDETEEINKIP